MSGKFLSTLKKAASTAGDVLSAKGDILTRTSSALARLGVGSNGQVLTAASGEATGLEWTTPADENPNTTKGDLSGFSSSIARVPIGTNDQVLTADSGEALGLKWATAGGGATVTHQTIIPTSTFTDSGTSLVDITGITFTADDNAGSSLAVSCLRVERSTTNAVFFRWVDDSTTIKIMSNIPSQVANLATMLTLPAFVDNDGQTVKMQLQNSSSGTVSVSGASGTADGSYVEVLEIV
tara:strand:+ start:65 stop:778 length:714 start_codon:yes stop_codon:yes gene_type:complete